MSRPIFIQTDLVGGLPDLGSLTAHTQPSGLPGGYAAQWTTGARVHTFTIKDLGIVDGANWFFGAGDPEIGGALAAAGIPGNRWTHKPGAAFEAALVASGVRTITRDSDSAVVGLAPDVVPAGETAKAVGLDGNEQEGETYTEEA